MSYLFDIVRAIFFGPQAVPGHTETMKHETARKLAAELDSSVGHSVIVECTDDRIIFCSELTGVHSLSIVDSTRARVLAHWRGFLANQPS